jgi:hypothetical protein
LVFVKSLEYRLFLPLRRQEQQKCMREEIGKPIPRRRRNTPERRKSP